MSDQLPAVCNLMSNVPRSFFNFLIPYELWSPTYILASQFLYTFIICFIVWEFQSSFNCNYVLHSPMKLFIWLFCLIVSFTQDFFPYHHEKGFQHHNLHTDVHCQKPSPTSIQIYQLITYSFWFSHSLTPLLVFYVYKQQMAKCYIFPYQRVSFSEYLPKLICS